MSSMGPEISAGRPEPQNDGKREDTAMEEKVFKTVSVAGVWNLVLGGVVLVTGIASGVLLIVNGARLLAGKSKIIF